jgi:hypothetical protein
MIDVSARKIQTPCLTPETSIVIMAIATISSIRTIAAMMIIAIQGTRGYRRAPQ